MKISVLTATYNRGNLLEKLYKSLILNTIFQVEIEWLIMDDGSKDNTEEIVNKFIKDCNNNKYLIIKYFKQNNQGKMDAINNVISYVSEDSTFTIECDSDDYFCQGFVKIIIDRYNEIKNKDKIYGMCFLKNDEKLCNIGSVFKKDNYETNMFNLYFKDGLIGDKAVVYLSNIRKQYKYILESNEKFCTEARLHNQMDKNYNIVCFNNTIMICEYMEEGYTKNINKVFMQNPSGHYEYFKQILSFNMKNVLLSKRLYAIKHYILFSYLTKSKNNIKCINGLLNKFLFVILYIPGIIKSYLYKKKNSINLEV